MITMKMNARIKSFFVILCVSILFSFSVFADEPGAKDSVTPTEPVQQETSGEKPPQAAPSQPAQPEKPLRDVFQSELRPLETPVRPSPEQPVEIQTNLEGITIGARGSRTVINGEVYKEGEDKKGIKILQIRKKEVDILINQSIQRTLSMLPGETRDIPMTLEEEGSAPASGEGETADTPIITEGQTQDKEPVYV